MTPGNPGRACPPLAPRSLEWRTELADQLDAVDQAARPGQRTDRIHEAITELGQLRAAVRALCP